MPEKRVRFGDFDARRRLVDTAAPEAARLLAVGLTFSLRLSDHKCTKAHNLLGWKPEVPFQTGIEMTADYLARQLPDYRPREYAI